MGIREVSVLSDEAYVKDLKETHDKPNENFDMDLATGKEKARCIKLYGLFGSLMRGRALQLVNAVEDSDGLDAWRSLSKTLKPTLNARGLALLGAATTWPAFSMNSALQPQLLKLEEVFDETVNSGRVETCYSFEMCRWTAQILLEFDKWRQCSIPNFEGTCVAMGSFSAAVGYFNVCK